MKLVEYHQAESMSLDDFQKLDVERACNFDFLTQGDEPDRCELMKSIYHVVFPWYDDEIHAGDTLNTYRIAIKKFYGNYYRFLDRKQQLEIIEIIKAYTPHEPEQIFEFEDTDASGNPYFQICNNYQLGNFGILPIRYGINPERAKSPYFDFFDDFLVQVYQLFEGNLRADDGLKLALTKQSDYFNQFSDFENFIKDNQLTDFFCEDDEGDTLSLIDISGVETFEEYVSLVTSIISKRGEAIFHILQDNAGVLLNTAESKKEDQLPANIEQQSHDYQKAYDVDANTAVKMAEYHIVLQFLDARDTLLDDWNQKISEAKQTERNLERVFQDKMRSLKHDRDLKLHMKELVASKPKLRSFLIESLFEVILGWLMGFAVWCVVRFAIEQFGNYYSNTHNVSHAYIQEHGLPFIIRFLRFVLSLQPYFYIALLVGLLLIVPYQSWKSEKKWRRKRNEEHEEIVNKYNQKEREVTEASDSSINAQKSEIEKLKKMADESINAFDTNNRQIVELYQSIPNEYQSKYTIATLLSYFYKERANSFKEAFELLDNQRHREYLEKQARQAAVYARRAADAQAETARAAQESAKRQAEMARATRDAVELQNRLLEDQKREQERHNREIEYRYNRK